MGVISNDDFNELLESLEKPIVKPVGVVKNFVGRGNSKAIPESLRKLVASEAIAGGKASELAKTFGVSSSSISAYKHDATSTASYDIPDEGLKKANDEVRNEITGAARLRLQSAINNITDEKLADAKLKDIASVARDMSAVIKNMEPERDRNDNPVTQFIYFAPKQRSETDYKVIEVTE